MTTIQSVFVGALVGFAAVYVSTSFFGVSISGWEAAALTTLSSTLIGWLGPRIPAPAGEQGPTQPTPA